MEKAVLETPFVTLWISGGVLNAKLSCKEINLAIAKEIVASRIAFSEGKAYPILTDATALKNINFKKEVRDYLTSDEGCQYISAGAILISSAVQMVLGNFFLKMHDHPFPTKLFTQREEALMWLKQFIDVNVASK